MMKTFPSAEFLKAYNSNHETFLKFCKEYELTKDDAQEILLMIEERERKPCHATNH